MQLKRWIAALLVLCMVLALSACRARADFSAELTLPESGFDFDDPDEETIVDPPADNDEMAQYAWELYSAAIEYDATVESYDITYEGKQIAMGKTTSLNARMVRAANGESVEMLVQTDDMQGYFQNNVGYFQTTGDKYWYFTDEDGFMSEMGFSDSLTLSEEMFADALVIDNGDGTRTVSCPLDGEYADAYAEEMLGASGTVTRAEVGVTVDEAGVPTVFTSSVAVKMLLYGEVSAESVNRYNAVGDAVTITPPEGLDSYRDANG